MFQQGQQIGGYTLIKRIGRGGFGEVWLAERRTALLTTKVAVKLPHDSLVNLETVRQEAVLWEQASGHANVLPIIEANIYDEQVVFISEYAPDGSLADLLKREGQISIEDAVRFTIGITAGLEFLHSRRIIHRDLKPANILLQGETPRLADFGISHALQTSVSSRSEHIKGTFSYMPPEAFDGKRNEQTDIWSVGVILYQMLRGSLPFPQENSTELFGAIVMHEPEPLPKEIPAKLKESVAKCLAKLPENRYQSAKDLRLDLEKILVGITHRSFAETEVLAIDDLKTIEDTEIETDEVAETVASEETQSESETGKSIPSNVRHLVDKKLKKRDPLQTFIAAILVVFFVILGSFMLYGVIKTFIEKKPVISNSNQNSNEDTLAKKPNKSPSNQPQNRDVNLPNKPSNSNDGNQSLTARDYYERGNNCPKEDYNCQIQNYSKAIELDPKPNPILGDYYFARGYAYYNNGNYDLAISDFTKSIESMSPNILFHQSGLKLSYNCRGNTYYGKGNYEAAIKDYTQSIQFDLSFAQAYQNRGDAYSKLGKRWLAEADYKKYRELTNKK
ncbi:MAG TPA: serine/threonine-protein kinase [Pyrinomonadaceae bacterium]|nr:serine/threonine-protein kinase [Pyrinomonadaceae bacterium]